jgi:hypothetical protein
MPVHTLHNDAMAAQLIDALADTDLRRTLSPHAVLVDEMTTIPAGG